MSPIFTRRASVADLDVLTADVQAGFDSYVEFAPLGWLAPEVEADTELMVELLNDGETWALLALDGSDPVGHIAFTPSRRRAPGQPWASSPSTPGLAHLWQLFVLPAWWGRGVAPLLHDAALEEMRARGYTSARLYTPSLHARARRFYERRGWGATGEQWNDHLTLMLTEYRVALGPAALPASA
ncbi:MAG TPA: GNAT family N-acetyltransferase [Solirubrobacteraceae bacterium]|jgi:GNAT superfamily N-acetyltransferase|nr:GNAT family N-acetyltransferase [Solirubrobacteraceae bacterium]